jgi:hypothetical protein
VEHEAANVMILLLEFAAVCGIAIAHVVEPKLDINAARYRVELMRGRGGEVR